jgi:two-component system, chemotaxis family, CheB/CheR fusion protein
VDKRVRAEDVAAERKRLLDEVRTLTAQRQSILENMAEGVIALDARGRIVYANREAVELLGPLPPGEREFSQLVDSRRILSADGSELDPAQAPDRAPLRGEDLPEREFLVRSEAGREATCSFRGGAVFAADGEPEGAVLTFWDVTERKRDAERRELLMRELDHRVRNMLATIMAMIRISNQPRQSKEAFVAALSGRVGAMARTHGILSEGQWKGATIGRLVDDEVSSAADARQLVLEGDRDVMLPPKEAADLALALHELATNAMKHGAWSVPEGRVALRWGCDRSGDAHVLRVHWKETGGPAIEGSPERRGFGSTLLRGIFAGGAAVSVEYEQDGLRCTMSVPLHDARPNGPIAEPQSGDATARTGGSSLEGVRVLVVEDEAVVRLDLVQILRDAGAVVVAEAGSLAAGLEKAAATKVEAAILDKNLNGDSSLPIARLLERQGAAIVFVSGYASAAPGLGFEEVEHAHLQKPVSPQSLVTALASAVMSRRS